MSRKHLIFTEILDAGGVAYIKALARKVFVAGDCIYCYTADAAAAKEYAKSFSSVVQLHLYDKKDQVFDNTHNAYLVARRMTQAMADKLEATFPDFFKLPDYPYDFNSLYQFGIQFTIARHKLNFYFNVMRTLADFPDDSNTNVIFLNQPYLFEPSWHALKALYPTLNRSQVEIIQTDILPTATSLLRFKNQFTVLKYWFKSLFASPVAIKQQNAVLTYARVVHHLKMMESTLSCLTEHYPVNVLNYFPKAFKAEDPKFYQTYDGLKQAELSVLNPRKFLPSRSFLHAVQKHGESLAERIIKSDMPSNEKRFYWNQLEQLLLFMKQMLRLEAIVTQLKPKVVCGCMEADTFGIMLCELRKTHGFKVINVLHGIAPFFEASDFFDFDAFLIWNQQTYDVLMGDSYARAETLQIVGNPYWKETANIDDVSAETEQVQEIRHWKRQNKLIVAYSQPQTNYTTPKQRREFFETLLVFLKQYPEVKLLVKKHPNEFDLLAESMIEEMGLNDRVRLYRAKELPLYDSIRLADLAVSICSTVLLEALYYHVPALAIDYANVNQALGNGLDKVTPVISAPEQAGCVISEVLTQGISHPAFNSTMRSYIYPVFENSYRERVQSVLAELGLLTDNSAQSPELSIQVAVASTF